MSKRVCYEVHTDGACAPTNPGPCAWGAVIVKIEDGVPLGHAQHLSGFLGHGTNQIAEISAATHGLRALASGVDVTLYSDSQYVINGITSWRRGWERNGWRNSQNKPVANKALWCDLFKEVDARNVKARWVKGHSGDVFNEAADALATSALLKASGKSDERKTKKSHASTESANDALLAINAGVEYAEVLERVASGELSAPECARLAQEVLRKHAQEKSARQSSAPRP